MTTGHEKTAGHTPGPWAATRSASRHDGEFDYAINAAEAPVLAEAFGRDAAGGRPSAEANARLIAAAPDLLGALKGACDEIAHLRRYANNNGGFYDSEVYEEGLAAISKAEGRS